MIALHTMTMMYSFAVIPVLIGPLQALLALLPAILIAVAGALVSLFRPRAMLGLLKLIWRFKVHLAAVILVFAGARWAWSKFAPPDVRRTGGLTTTGDGADWPIFRGDVQRRGAPENVTGPRTGRVNWSAERGKIFYASPAIVGSRIYMVSVSGLGPLDQEGDGTVYCFDADTGATLWSSSPKFVKGARRYRGTFASPVIKGRYLVCGEGLHKTEKCRVICLDLSPGKEGNLLWSHETSGHVECTPVISSVTFTDDSGKTVTEDRVFVGAGDKDGYYCLRLSDGLERWHVRGDRYLDAETSLLVHDNVVFAGLGNDGKALCVLDAATGKEINRVEMPYPVFSPPCLVEGKLILGMGNGDYVFSASDLNLPQRGEVWCLDVAQLTTPGGTILPDWKLTLDDTVLGAIAVSGGDAYAACADGTVYAIDWRNGGRVRAKWKANDRIKSSPAVSSDTVYVVTESGWLYGLDHRDFLPVWECRAGSAPLCISSPSVHDGRIFMGTAADGFVCVGKPGEKQIFVWTGHLGGAGKSGAAVSVDFRKLGGMQWNYPPELTGEETNSWFAAPVAVSEKQVFVPVAGGTGSILPAGVVCLSARPTDTVAAMKPLWRYDTVNGVFSSPAVVGDEICLVVDGQVGDTNRHLHALTILDGKSKWTRPVAANASGVFAATATTVFVQDRPGDLAAVDLEGRERWRINMDGSIVRGPVLDGPRLIVATGQPNALHLLDAETGLPLWRVDLGAAPTSWPVRVAQHVIIATETDIQARHLVNGAALARDRWFRHDPDVASSDLTLLNNLLLYVNSGGEIVIRSAQDGKHLADPVPGAKTGLPLLPGEDQVLYTAANGAIMKLSLIALHSGSAAVTKLKPVAWLSDMADLGIPVTPLVTDGMHVYTVRSGWGLICMKSER